MPSHTRFAIAGGGIIGLAVAYKLVRSFPAACITVFEKEPEVGRHQSGHNSGVLHAGLYYKPGSLKARLAVAGIRRMKAFCREHGIPHEECGKLVVACSEEEIPRLRELLARGTANGLTGLRWLGPEQMREIEPHAAGLAAVHVPEEGIVDYERVCAALKRLVEAAGGQVLTRCPVAKLRRGKRGWVVAAGGREE